MAGKRGVVVLESSHTWPADVLQNTFLEMSSSSPQEGGLALRLVETPSIYSETTVLLESSHELEPLLWDHYSRPDRKCMATENAETARNPAKIIAACTMQPSSERVKSDHRQIWSRGLRP